MASTPISAQPRAGLRKLAGPTFSSVRRLTAASTGALNTARLAGAVLLAVLIVAGASLVYLNLAAYVNTTSNRLSELTKERRTLEWQRAEKLRQLAKLNQTERLEARAAELGFRAPRTVTYLPVTPEVAAALAASPRPAQRIPVPTDDAPQIWTTVKDQFNRWLGKTEVRP